MAAAVGMAWGIRGDYGHVVGAMYPGAVLGLAWVAVAGSPALLARMPVIAALTAGGIGAGGTMSYGILHGYAQADTLPNYAYGLGALFLQGGCWGTFGGCLAGLLCERRPVRTGDWLGLLGSVLLGGWLLFAVAVDLLGFQVNPPRNNIAVAFVGAAVGQFLWLAATGRAAGLRGAAFGFAGFGLGMAGGRVLANAAVHLAAWGYTINHWNVMEITCGFVGGGVFAWGMLGLGRVEPAGEPDEFRWPAVLGAVFTLGVIPVWHLSWRVPERVGKWAESLRGFGHPDPDGQAATVHTAVAVVAAAGAAGAAGWAVALARGWRWPSWLPAVWLSAVMLGFQQLTALAPWTPARTGYLDTHRAFWALFLFLLVYLAVARPGSRPAETAEPDRLRAGRLAVVTVAGLGLLIALAGLTNGPRTMRSANTRWPVWSWSDKPATSAGGGAGGQK
ncbi:MAG: hypothetical protein U0871_29425 [Gemmataceae bacterium]